MLPGPPPELPQRRRKRLRPRWGSQKATKRVGNLMGILGADF